MGIAIWNMISQITLFTKASAEMSLSSDEEESGLLLSVLGPSGDRLSCPVARVSGDRLSGPVVLVRVSVPECLPEFLLFPNESKNACKSFTLGRVAFLLS